MIGYKVFTGVYWGSARRQKRVTRNFVGRWMQGLKVIDNDSIFFNLLIFLIFNTFAYPLKEEE